MPRAIPIDFVVDADGCFICTSHFIDPYGYPRKRWGGKNLRPISRFVYEQMFGEIPEGHVIRHKCDNPGCINPEHLEAGTIQDNNNDKVLRGRIPKGAKVYNAILNENQVKAIKYLFQKEGLSTATIAKDLHIGFHLVSDVVKGRNWKHVSME